MEKHHYSSVMDCERRIKTKMFFSTIIGIPVIGVLFWHFSTVAHTYYQDHGNTSPETSENEEENDNERGAESLSRLIHLIGKSL